MWSHPHVAAFKCNANHCNACPGESCRYRQHWAAAAASGAHAISLTSWNEWGEGTQLEPAQPWTDPATGTPYKDYGDPWLYLNITQQEASGFIQQWHNKQERLKADSPSDLGAGGSKPPQQGTLEPAELADDGVGKLEL